MGICGFRFFYQLVDIVEVERLGKIVVGSQTHGFDGVVHRVLSGHHYDFKLRANFSGLLHQLEAADTFHKNI